jgi:pSer/pThr/pTyr-binding forkhead associated (FHA) protein
MFCHKCGQQISASHTVAIASVRPRPRPRLLLVIEGEQTGDEYELKDETIIGRVSGDITFPHDDYMSGRHARVERREKKFVLVDEGSRNGSFVRIKNEVEIEPGDMILIGRQVFRFEI